MLSKKQWLVSCRMSPWDESSETDHAYYIQPVGLEKSKDWLMVVPTVGAIISDNTHVDEAFDARCDPRFLRRQSRIFFTGSTLITSFHFRTNFDVLIVLASFPQFFGVNYVDPAKTGDTGVDVFQANFGQGVVMDNNHRSLQLWKAEDMHLPLLKRGFQPACRIHYSKSYRFRVDEARTMKSVDVRLFGRVNRYFSFNHFDGDSHIGAEQTAPTYFPVWMIMWEYKGFDFNVEGDVPGTGPRELHNDRHPVGNVTGMVMDRVHQKLYFKENILPMPITDASRTRKLVQPIKEEPASVGE